MGWMMTAHVAKHEIIAGLRTIGIKKGDILLAHSSLKGFGYVDGGADTVIDALLETVGNEGTVMLPTITGTREHGPDFPPILDVRNTPCWTGLIPETFRKRPDAVRSLNPTHSVSAIGAHVPLLQSDHINSYTPCDEHSPYQKNAEAGGKILFLGVDMRCSTTLHACEEIAAVPYHLQKKDTPCVVIDAEGIRHEVVMRLHSWFGPERNFPVIEDELLRRGVLKKGRIGDAVIAVMDAAPAIDFVVAQLRKDPYYLCLKR